MDTIPSEGRADWPAVVVAGAYRTGVVLMRNLARRRLRVCCIDCNPSQPGFRTVYGKTHLCPNPDEDGDGWLEFMITLSARMGGRPVLMASADQFVSAIARYADALKDHFVFCHASSLLQAQLATKEHQYAMAEAHGLPVPKTRFVRSADDVAAFGRHAEFPCVLKPLHFREWERLPIGHPLHQKKLIASGSPEELASSYRLSSEASPDAVIQEVIEGPDWAKLVYLSCYGRGGERIGACMVRELRAFPIHFGSGSMVEPFSDEETDFLCDQFLRHIGYRGLCEIELKRDSRDGRVKMIEANPRYSMTADAAPYAGVDLGWLHYLDLAGQRLSPVAPTSRKFRHVILERDIPAIRQYRRERLLTWGELAWSYRPRVRFFDFDPRDWRLTLSTCVNLAKVVAGPSLRRIFPKKRP